MTSPYSLFEKPYEPQSTELRLRTFWQDHQFYRSSPNPNKKPYTILMPPPNVTGDLTMGHMMYTLQDVLVRWHRARGYEACWIPGTDHASISTESKVTKMLEGKGINKKEIGREAFLKYAYEWKEEYGNRIVESLKTLGISCDWSKNTFTMDEKYSASVIKAIVKLYRDGLVYRSHKLVNWCPVSQSVISDEEVNFEERSGNLWHLKYFVEGSATGEYIVVATTRPETLFGDLAVAVHPEDPRYAHLLGRNVIVPVCKRLVPIIADTYVEKDFGSGAVKITPAHDMNDFEMGKRHNLGLLNIMNPNASLNQNVPEAYVGLDRYVARKKLIQELTENGSIEKIEPHKLIVGISERGQVPIEYYLSEQWYIRAQKLADLTLDATRSGRLKLIPAHQEKVWEHWLTNIQDWCISRQLWWGHRLPMYTCTKCQHVHCEEQAPARCEHCGHDVLVQDPDVLDTWASSWLWPIGVHNWANPSPEEAQNLAYYYPTDVIVTGADIIFFWIARMVMAGEYFTHKTPFKYCYFTPIIRDAQGRKMSKSLGNSPDVTQIMSKYGTCAMRFSLVNQVVSGQDIFWKDECCDLGKTFANKLWNVGRFLTMNTTKLGVSTSLSSFDDLKELSSDPIMGWVTSEFFDCVARCHQHIERFEFSQYTGALYEFVWMVYCDWFVELAKPRFSEEAPTTLSQQTLVLALQIFDGILRLLHPIMPYLTDEIWHILDESRVNNTIGFCALPEPRAELVDKKALAHMREIQSVVGAVRTIRGQFQIHPGQELKVSTKESSLRFGNLVPQLEFLTKAKFFFEQEKLGLCAPSLINNYEIYVSLEGLIDRNVEKERLSKKMAKIQSTMEGIEKRLGNADFVAGAPKHILEGAQKQYDDCKRELAFLKVSFDALN